MLETTLEFLIDANGHMIIGAVAIASVFFMTWDCVPNPNRRRY